jgi:hypothetical protein
MGTLPRLLLMGGQSLLTEDEVESPQIPFSHFFLLLGYSDPLTHFLPLPFFFLLLCLVIFLRYSDPLTHFLPLSFFLLVLLAVLILLGYSDPLTPPFLSSYFCSLLSKLFSLDILIPPLTFSPFLFSSYFFSLLS